MKKSNIYIPLIGRILMSLLFIIAGINKIFNFTGTAGYMAMQGMPFVSFFLVCAIIVEIGGGLLLIAGYKTKIVAIVLFLYLIPTTLIFHHFWTYSGMQRQNMQVHFLKNLSIMGGMLMVYYFGAGPKSVDSKSEER